MMARAPLAVVLVFAIAAGVSAQEPNVTAVTPAAVKPGESTRLQLGGANLANAKALWISFPGEVSLAADVPDNGTKADQVTYSVQTPADVPVGIHALRVLTDKGVSPLRFLLVDDLPSVAQAGNNTSAATAQVLPLPCAVDGNVGNLSVQYFKFPAAEGQRLSFEVLARRIGSPLDPMIRLLDAQGRELAFSDDAAGLSGDSQLQYTFKTAGDYLLELRDIRYQGGAYRLRIGDFPCVTAAFPLAVQRGQTASITLAGPGTENVAAATVTAPAATEIEWLPVSAKRTGGASSGFASVQVVDRPQLIEQEPNNAAEQAQRIDLAADINGRFETRGDVDRYVFSAKKDQSVVFTGVTRVQGSPTDLVLKVLGADGKQVAMVDDTGTDEGTLTFKAPADGDYTLLVEDLTKRGGPEHAYRIEVSPPLTTFALAVSADTWNVPAGGATSATVTAKRQGYGGEIELSVVGLPEGFVASPSVIGAGRNDALLTVTAPANATAGALQTVRVIGRGKQGEQEIVAAAEFTGVLKQRFANMRFPPQHIATTAAASVAPSVSFTWKAEPAELVFGKDLSTKTKLIVQRASGIGETVTVAVQPPQNGLPAGVTVGVKNIDKGQAEVEIAVSADGKAPLGDFTAGLVGTLKQGNNTVTQPLALRLKLQPPLTASLNAGDAKLARGGELTVKVNVQRNPALQGAATVTLANLPNGVTAAPGMLAADAGEIELKLTAAADAAQGTVNNVAAKVEIAANGKKYEGTSGNVTLTVE
uniref:Uncharacterized protein n=1 Tax=Schlesneria paludicola TaxID=360056 RepID=A0A7C2JZR5_9PLAN